MTRASVWLVWQSAPVDSIILVRQNITCCVRRYAVVRCPRYVYMLYVIAYVICSVPQGSVLGPLFFMLYMADLTAAKYGVFLHAYVDDTCTSGTTKWRHLLTNLSAASLTSANGCPPTD